MVHVAMMHSIASWERSSQSEPSRAQTEPRQIIRISTANALSEWEANAMLPDWLTR